MNCMEANVENFHVDLEAYKVIASITYLFGLKSNRVYSRNWLILLLLVRVQWPPLLLFCRRPFFQERGVHILGVIGA